MAENKYHNTFKGLDDQYNSWKIIHKDIQDHILPRRGNFVERGKPDDPANVNRSASIINGAATRANRILGSGMQGGLANPSRRWFELGLQDFKLAKYGPVKNWLLHAANVMYWVYRSSNFYSEIHRVFEEQGGFGTAAIIQEEDFNTVIHFTTFPTGEYRLQNNTKGIADILYRHYWMTAQNMVKEFGEGQVTDAVKVAAKRDKTPFEYFEVVHGIEPREGYDPTKIDSTNMPYRSVKFEYKTEDGKLLHESGYNERPHAAPRWTPVGNAAYGLGPGCEALADAKMIQEMEKESLKAIHKAVNPPLSVPSQFKNVVSQLPGAHNYSEGDGKSKITALFDMALDISSVENKIHSVEQRISEIFFNDVFTLITNIEKSMGRAITATEILERKQEKMILLGPTIERQMFELLDPIVERTFNICLRRGLFPPVPEELSGQALKVNYVSVLAQAQRLADAQSMEAYALQAERIVGLDESTVLKTNWDQYLEEYGEIVGVPPNIVRNQDEVDQLRQQIQEAEAAAQEAENARMAAEAVRNLGQSNMDGTALGAMAGGE